MVVVVSAMAGVTNQLLSIADAGEKGDIALANERDRRAAHPPLHGGPGTRRRAGQRRLREIRELHETLRQAVYGVYLLRELTPRSRDLIVALASGSRLR